MPFPALTLLLIWIMLKPLARSTRLQYLHFLSYRSSIFILFYSGGLAAVIYTDALQTAIMIIGAFVLMILSFVRVPYDELKVKYFQAIPNETLNNPNITCGYPRNDAFHIFRDPVTSDLPWPGMVFGITVSATWYWCTDQVRTVHISY